MVGIGAGDGRVENRERGVVEGEVATERRGRVVQEQVEVDWRVGLVDEDWGPRCWLDEVEVSMVVCRREEDNERKA